MWVGISAFHEEDLIAAQLEQWQNRKGISNITVYLSEKRWFQTNKNNGPEWDEPVDKTEEIIREFFPDVEIKKEFYHTETDARRFHLQRVKDEKISYAVIADCDEFYTDADWNFIHARATLNTLINGYRILMKTYYWNLHKRFEPMDSWTPVILINPLGATFQDRAPIPGLETFDLIEPPHFMYHLSWIGPIERIRLKLLKHGHFDIITNEWKNWHFTHEHQLPYGMNQWMYRGFSKEYVTDHCPYEIAEKVLRWQDKLGLKKVECHLDFCKGQ